MTVRSASVTLKPPFRAGGALPVVTIDAVFIREGSSPAGIEPIEWLLPTSLPVDDFEDACRVVGYYVGRWTIEVFFGFTRPGVGSRKSNGNPTIDCCPAWRCI